MWKKWIHLFYVEQRTDDFNDKGFKLNRFFFLMSNDIDKVSAFAHCRKEVFNFLEHMPCMHNKRNLCIDWCNLICFPVNRTNGKNVLNSDCSNFKSFFPMNWKIKDYKKWKTFFSNKIEINIRRTEAFPS